MSDLRQMTDEELVKESQAGDQEAEEILLKRYGTVVKREIRFLFLVGAETEDLTQEAMIGLVKAIREYKPGRGTTFHTYATGCIRNQIRSAITAANRKKHFPLNTYISIYEDSTEQGEQMLSRQMGEEDATNPETIAILRESLLELQQKLSQKLSPLEQTVAELYLEGNSYSSIAAVIGKPERSVNNALTRIRGKLKTDESQ